MKFVLIALINLYQRTFSPDHGWFSARYPYGYCRFYPSCSEYAKQALLTFGVWKGLLLALRRIVRCNPWASPQVDPVEPSHNS